MQYSMLNELMAQTRAREIERVDLRRILEAQALVQRTSLRRSLAAALVRIGVSLDHGAGERVLAASAARAAH